MILKFEIELIFGGLSLVNSYQEYAWEHSRVWLIASCILYKNVVIRGTELTWILQFLENKTILLLGTPQLLTDLSDQCCTNESELVVFKYKSMATKSQSNPRSMYKVPTGYLMLNGRLAGSEIHRLLKEKYFVNVDETLGSIDIMYLDGKGILYVDEHELTSIEDAKKRILNFKTKVNQGLIILESVSFDENFMEFQNFVAIESKLNLLMVVSKSEAVDLIGKIIKEELIPKNNPFLIKQKPISKEKCILNALQNIPKLGIVKAKMIMENFHTIEKLLGATEEKLILLVGKSSARVLYSFLHSQDDDINI